MEEMTPTLQDPPTLDHQIDNLLRLVRSAEAKAEDASQAANEAEDRANDLESSSSNADIPDDYTVRRALDTISEMQDALDALRDAASPDFTEAQTAASQAREAAEEAAEIVAQIRVAVDALIAAVRDGATVAPAEPSPLDKARAEHARLEAEAREAEADFDRAYRRRNDALHAAANAAVVVRRLEETAR
jgi:hypothetical protein